MCSICRIFVIFLTMAERQGLLLGPFFRWKNRLGDIVLACAGAVAIGLNQTYLTSGLVSQLLSRVQPTPRTVPDLVPTGKHWIGRSSSALCVWRDGRARKNLASLWFSGQCQGLGSPPWWSPPLSQPFPPQVPSIQSSFPLRPP